MTLREAARALLDNWGTHPALPGMWFTTDDSWQALRAALSREDAEIAALRASNHAWDEKWMRVQSDLQDAHQESARLRARVEVLSDLLNGFASQYGCACGHPACKRCRDTNAARAALSPTPTPEVKP